VSVQDPRYLIHPGVDSMLAMRDRFLMRKFDQALGTKSSVSSGGGGGGGAEEEMATDGVVVVVSSLSRKLFFF